MSVLTYAGLERAFLDGTATVAVPRVTHDALLDIESGRRPLAAVRHPLGFFCLPVLRDGDLGVCVHLWTSTVEAAVTTTSTIHCHSWQLSSFVLYGRVTHTLIDVIDDPGGEQRLFEVISAGGTDEVRPTPRRVRCRERSVHPTGRGETYRMDAGQFHSSLPGDEGEAATVVLGRTRGTDDLTVGAAHGPGHVVRREACSPEETTALVRTALERLTAATGPVPDGCH
ncbi:hypothetical protein [Kineosporia succinea]|uniref:Uncharacterized protein n=1 Tax=Kineosporia succinea TaxID=84632 RepID=A0ABT9PF53_9ACTN|nr:hypothetical protein [Kineosporia succinea]MDP9831029.1 hypothetical protein [Kineosporia succinea]